VSGGQVIGSPAAAEIGMSKPSHIIRRTAIRAAIAGAYPRTLPVGNPIQRWQPGGTNPA